jgi:dephospho-CoA kinase
MHSVPSSVQSETLRDHAVSKASRGEAQASSGHLRTLLARVYNVGYLVSIRMSPLISERIPVVGLTGGIATGKSTVSSLLKSRQIPVIDADVLAREAVQPGTKGLTQIVAHFGSEVLLPDGTLDRKKVGAIIFNNEVKRKKLNSIVHPAVSRAILWNVFWCWLRGENLCVVDVPLLIEGGLWKWMGKVVVVYWYVSL